MLAASAASADEGWYASLSGLLVMASDTEKTETTPDNRSYSNTPFGSATVASDHSFDTGFGVLAAVGYDSGFGLRGEIELGYRTSELDSLEGAAVRTTTTLDERGRPTTPPVSRDFVARGRAYDSESGPAPADGGMDTLSLMANAIYAFDTDIGVKPYFGAGVGLARHDATFYDDTIWVWGGGTSNYDHYGIGISKHRAHAFAFAWQAMAGVALPITERVELRLGWRYFETADADFGTAKHTSDYVTLQGNDAPGIGPVKASYASHSFEAGFAVGF